MHSPSSEGPTPPGEHTAWWDPRTAATAKIIAFCTLASVCYGILHDQITTRVCLEYFTIAHPPLFHTRSPTLLALCWGTVATLPIGLGLGTILALVSQFGSAAPCPVGVLRRRVGGLLVVMGVAASCLGALGFFLAERGIISLPSTLAAIIPEAQHHRFMAVWFAHNTSYAVGLVGGVGLCLQTWRQRGRPSVLTVFPRSPWALARAATIAAIVIWVWWRH